MTDIRDDDVILHHFYRVARQRPDAVYLTQPVGRGRVDDISFARALDESKRMAAYLRSLRLPPRSHIAIISKNCAHFILSDLAIWMAGHVSVALYPTLDADSVRHLLEHSEARLLFVGKLDGWDEIRKGVPEGLPCVAYPLAPETSFPAWNAIVAQHDPIPDEPRRSPEDWALIIYTSGSTGRPKGVIHSFATISAPTHGMIKLLAVDARDRYLTYLPLAHAMERWVAECVSLVAGAHLYFAESVDTFIEDLKRARPTLFLSVPRLWLKFQHGVHAKVPQSRLERMLKVPIVSGIIKKKILRNLGLGEVRFAGSGSAPMPAQVLTWYRDLGLELLEGYGMTENFSYSHVTRPGRGRPGFVGHPHPDVECKLSEEGEVLVKSPGSMIGYLKEPELTREAFTADEFLRTGDRGVIADGQLMITGRLKELFKTTKGKYVAPAPIENMLNADGRIEQSCVAGSGQAAAHAVVQLAEHVHGAVQDPSVRAEVTRSLEALLEQVNRKIPPYERLAFIAVARDLWTVEGGWLTPSMKIKRSVIEERYAPELERWYAAGAKVLWQE